ncbi:hypothetical protein GCM10009111_07010 [Colwellia asteriadis]|uniref:Histidine phosphatase family protein n=1 Tax=Colwellia asteriadis TaxID=517723 RepID=A0ABN1L3W2_9GAMM
MEIVLIRHGKPVTAEQGEYSPKLSAAGYAAWVHAYNHSSVILTSRPKATAMMKYSEHYCIASNLKRAIESAVIFTGAQPEQQWSILREMDIPRYKLPWRLKPYSWLVLSRILWFLGVKKLMSTNVESFKQAKIRIQGAAHKLNALASEQEQVIVFAHGVTNHFLKRELMKQGWVLTQKSDKFWGETCLQKN